jgi:hypothetical protein
MDPEALEKLEAEELVARWQRHRELCLEMAIRLGATSPERAIEMAEELSRYILNGRPRAPPSADQGERV